MDDDLSPPLLQRVRATHWVVLDAVVAAFPATLMLTSLRQREAGFALPLPIGVMLVLLATMPVILRRQRPIAVLTVLLISQVFAAGEGVVRSPLVLGLLAMVLYVIALEWPRGRAVAALSVVIAATWVLVMQLAAIRSVTTSALPYAVFLASAGTVLVCAGWAIGTAVRVQREYAERERMRAAERAVADERLRIARDLHDVVSHTISIIAVEAGVANHLADSRPDQVRRSMTNIEATSRTAVRELRQLLGVLRPDLESIERKGHDAVARTPGLADLERLIDRLTRAGVLVELLTEGTVRRCPPGVDLAAYRIVQEALTNVLKHAEAARVVVVISYGADQLNLDITDDGRGVAGVQPEGHGLSGMRERVALYGGKLSAGPAPGRGFRVRASLSIIVDES